MILNKDIRKQLKKLFLMYKIKRNGEIHVLGIMPNTKIFGWYLLGFTGTDYIDNLLWHPDGNTKKGKYDI